MFPELRRKVFNAVGQKTPFTELCAIYAKEYGVRKDVVACAVDYNVYHNYIRKYRIKNKTYLAKNATVSSYAASFR